MQLLAIILFVGILALLFVGVSYFGSSQGQGRSRSVFDDWSTAKGAYNRYAARNKLDKIAAEQRRRSRPHKHHPRS